MVMRNKGGWGYLLLVLIIWILRWLLLRDSHELSLWTIDTGCGIILARWIWSKEISHKSL